jgi:hypothetical protein
MKIRIAFDFWAFKSEHESADARDAEVLLLLLLTFSFHQSACLIGVNKSVARGSVKFSRTNGEEEQDEENDLKKFTIWHKEKIEEKNRSTDKGAKREK